MDPSIYLVDDEQKSPTGAHVENKEINPEFVASDDNATVQMENIHAGNSIISSSSEGVSVDPVDALSNSMQPMDLVGSISGQKSWSLFFVRF